MMKTLRAREIAEEPPAQRMGLLRVLGFWRFQEIRPKPGGGLEGRLPTPIRDSLMVAG
jgi:hypothetical protein